MLDALDQKILAELRNRGYMKSSALAQYFDVGERTLRRRIGILRQSGIIQILAVPNPFIYGCEAWARIGLKVDLRYLDKVTQELLKHKSIHFIAHTSGTFDLMISAHYETAEKLSNLVNYELTTIEGIKNTETMILIEPRKYYSFSWSASESKTEQNKWKHDEDGSNKNEEILDKIDYKIIDILRGNALADIKDIRKVVKLGEIAIRNRIKMMRQNNAFKVEVIPNPKILEYEVWATMGITVSDGSIQNVMDKLILLPPIYLAAISLGRFNIIISARFRNLDLLTNFVKNDLANIQGISNVERFLHTRPLKYNDTIW